VPGNGKPFCPFMNTAGSMPSKAKDWVEFWPMLLDCEADAVVFFLFGLLEDRAASRRSC
jgi:hypothetical protein